VPCKGKTYYVYKPPIRQQGAFGGGGTDTWLAAGSHTGIGHQGTEIAIREKKGRSKMKEPALSHGGSATLTYHDNSRQNRVGERTTDSPPMRVSLKILGNHDPRCGRKQSSTTDGAHQSRTSTEGGAKAALPEWGTERGKKEQTGLASTHRAQDYRTGRQKERRNGKCARRKKGGGRKRKKRTDKFLECRRVFYGRV